VLVLWGAWMYECGGRRSNSRSRDPLQSIRRRPLPQAARTVTHADHSRTSARGRRGHLSALTVRVAATTGMVCACILCIKAVMADDWPRHERLTREQVIAAVASSSEHARADLSSKNLTGLDLSAVDFKGANLSATVFNRSDLRRARLANCNLTVSFGEGADFRQADLRGAEMFSMQLAGADLRGADLTGARFIGDMNHARLEGAVLRNLRGGADMRNQSMGLMNARFNSAKLDGADLTGADVSRADFSFAHLSGAKLIGASLIRVDLSGANLSGADLSNADLRNSTLIDTDFTSTRVSGAKFDGSNGRNVRGLENAAARGASGRPAPRARRRGAGRSTCRRPGG